MRDRDRRFNIGDGDDIDKHIKKLQRELDEMLMKGAPTIKEEEIEKESRKTKEKIEKEEEEKVPFFPEKKYSGYYEDDNTSPESKPGIFRNTKFYIIVFGIVAFLFTLIKAPIFRYTTPLRQDNDLPQIEVCFKYYNNILGKQTKNETIVHIGNEIIVIPITMEKWFNLGKERKLIAIEYYRKR